LQSAKNLITAIIAPPPGTPNHPRRTDAAHRLPSRSAAILAIITIAPAQIPSIDITRSAKDSRLHVERVSEGQQTAAKREANRLRGICYTIQTAILVETLAFDPSSLLGGEGLEDHECTGTQQSARNIIIDCNLPMVGWTGRDQEKRTQGHTATVHRIHTSTTACTQRLQKTSRPRERVEVWAASRVTGPEWWTELSPLL